jgi:hypothetical protein
LLNRVSALSSAILLRISVIVGTDDVGPCMF